MAIRITRNNEGNCINFEGSSNPTYWNACLSGEVDSELPDTINIINDIQTAQTGEVQYEFFRIPYTEFEDRDGNTFDTAADTAAYITDQANVIGLNTTGLDLTNTDVGFRLDDTTTSIILDNGFNFGINTIKAVPDSDGTIHIHAIGSDLPSGTGEASSKKHFEKLDHTRVTIEGAPVGGGLNDVVNTLNELFTAGPFAAVVVSDPYATLIPNLTGDATTGTLIGNAIDPSGPNIAARGPGASPRYNDSGWLSDDTIDRGGEYFTLNMIMPNNPDAVYFFGMGLVNTLSSQTIGDSTAGDPDNFANDSSGNSAAYGFQWSNWWHTSPNGPLAVYGADSGYIEGPGWSSFASSDEGVGFEAGSPVTVQVGIDFNGFIEIGYYDISAGEFIQIARSDYPVPEGNEYRLGVRFARADGVNILDVPKVHLIDEADPTMFFRTIESPDGLWHYPIFATEEEANFYDLNHDGTTGSGTSHTHVYPDDPTNTVWYMPDTGGTMNATERPQISPGTFQGVEIQYTEITSLVNQDLKPPAFTNNTVTVNELASVNIAINPADHSWTTTVTDNESSGLVLDSSDIHLIGTSPEVTSDNVSNPNDVYTFTVTRTNNYGTSTGTLTVIVNNLTAPVYSSITGFTHLSGSTALAAASAMDSGSVVEVDETLADEQRFIILQSYVEENILPSLQTAGDKYYIGTLNTGTDVSSISASDFDLAFVWEYETISSHTYSVIQDGSVLHTATIGSTTDSYYDYAIEVIDSTAWMIGCNVNAINTEPSPAYGGSFSNATSATYGESLPLQLAMSYTGSGTATFSLSSLSEIVTPAPSNWIQVTSNGSNVLSFDGSSSLSLQAGNAYRFLMEDVVYADQTTATLLSASDVLRFTADGTTEYTTVITRVGTPGVDGSYVEFVVPTDVPPLQWYTDSNGIGSATGINISGSTYVVPISGITKEGPVANQTGTNVADAGEHGWISLDEPLAAGERLVFDNAFFDDLLTETKKSNTIFAIGLKGDNWTNTKEVNSNGAAASGEFFKGNTYIVGVWNSGASGIDMRIIANGVTGNSFYMNSASLYPTTCAFLEITSSGNNIRAAFGRNGDTGVTQGDESTKAYADWSSYKGQTGEQGYGITSKDVVMSFWTYDGGAIDGDQIDWTGLSEINVPTPAPSHLTSWTKALDFNGSNEHLKQVGTGMYDQPMQMNGLASTLGLGTRSQGETSDVSTSRPWATAVVFKSDGYNANQMIWNQGEGNSSGNDNIFVNVTASGDVNLGWGREGVGYNQCRIATGINSSTWYGVYIAHSGERLGGNNASAANLADCFDIRIMSSADSFASLSNNLSVAANWTSTGYRMDRTVAGNFTIGSRGVGNLYSYRGKVASMIVTTLIGVGNFTQAQQPGGLMYNDAQIKTMITDPVKWVTDYKVRQGLYNQSGPFRPPASQYTLQPFLLGNQTSAYRATQVWLMGDGASDSYANGIRNYIYTGDQNSTKLQLNSMVSNDIENVSIPGLT